MLEMKITIAAPDLAAAINNLAVALANGKNPHTVCNQYGGDCKHIDHVGTITMGMSGKARPATPAAPVNPTPAPTVPTQAPGAPLSATPAQTAAQIAPTVPVAQPAPVANTAPAPTVPTSAPQYTLDMIARAGAALVDAGKMDALCGLLAKYGVEALTALDPAQYGNFANDLRALGAQI